MECTLGRGDMLRLEGGAKGITIHCLCGTIWLTKGDGADYLISRGESCQVAAGAAAVVEALGSAGIRLEAAACKGARVRPALLPPPTLPPLGVGA